MQYVCTSPTHISNSQAKKYATWHFQIVTYLFFSRTFFWSTRQDLVFFFWKRKMELGVRKIVRLTMTNDQGMAQAKMDFFGSGYSPKYKAVGSHLSFMRVISHQRIQVSTHCKLSKNTRYYASSQDLQMSLIAFGLVLPNDRKEHECYLLCFGTSTTPRLTCAS